MQGLVAVYGSKQGALHDWYAEWRTFYSIGYTVSWDEAVFYFIPGNKFTTSRCYWQLHGHTDSTDWSANHLIQKQLTKRLRSRNLDPSIGLLGVRIMCDLNAKTISLSHRLIRASYYWFGLRMPVLLSLPWNPHASVSTHRLYHRPYSHLPRKT